MAEETQGEIRKGSYRRYSPVRRTRTIGVRLTDEEYSQVRQAAQRDVLTPSSWVGKLATTTAEGVLSGTTQNAARDGLLIDREALIGIGRTRAHLAPVANNLNQIAKALNSGAAVPQVAVLDSVLDQVRLTISDIDDLVGRLVGRRVHCRSCQNPHCHGARPQFQTAEGDQETASSDFDEDEPGYEDWYE